MREIITKRKARRVVGLLLAAAFLLVAGGGIIYQQPSTVQAANGDTIEVSDTANLSALNPGQTPSSIAPWSGNYLKLGTYNSQPIYWRILNTNESSYGSNTILLMADQALGANCYAGPDDGEHMGASYFSTELRTGPQCPTGLRPYLRDVYATSFDTEEQSVIASSKKITSNLLYLDSVTDDRDYAEDSPIGLSEAECNAYYNQLIGTTGQTWDFCAAAGQYNDYLFPPSISELSTKDYGFTASNIVYGSSRLSDASNITWSRSRQVLETNHSNKDSNNPTPPNFSSNALQANVFVVFGYNNMWSNNGNYKGYFQYLTNSTYNSAQYDVVPMLNLDKSKIHALTKAGEDRGTGTDNVWTLVPQSSIPPTVAVANDSLISKDGEITVKPSKDIVRVDVAILDENDNQVCFDRIFENVAAGDSYKVVLDSLADCQGKLPDGIYYARVTVLDAAWNPGFADGPKFELDNTSPVATVTNDALINNYSPIQIEASDAHNIQAVRIHVIDESGSDVCSDNDSLTAGDLTIFKLDETKCKDLPDGKYHVQAYVFDEIWNFAIVDGPEFTLDNTSPVATVTNDAIINKDASIEIASSDANGIRSVIIDAIDENGNAVCNDDSLTADDVVTFSLNETKCKDLPDGKYHIQARVWDGVWNYCYANGQDFVLDTRSPEIKLWLDRTAYADGGTETNPAVINSKTVRPERQIFDNDESVNGLAKKVVVEKKDANDNWASYNTDERAGIPALGDISHLADGEYRIQATDLAGNISAWFYVTVDKTAPTSTVAIADCLCGGNAAITQHVNDADARGGKLRVWKLVNGTQDDSQFYAIGEIAVDQNGDVIYSLDTLAKLYGDGTYRFKFTSYDKYGNEGASFNSTDHIDVTIDNTKPEVVVNVNRAYEINSGDTVSTANSVPEIQASDNFNLSKVEIEDVDGKVISHWDKTGTAQRMKFDHIKKEGAYTIYVYDACGNKSDGFAVVIDNSAPTGTVTYSPAGPSWTNKNVMATLETNEPITMPDGWEKIDDTHFKRIFTANDLHDVALVDKAGNVGSATATVSWIDKIAPTITANPVVSADGNTLTPNVAFADQAGSGINQSTAACAIYASANKSQLIKKVACDQDVDISGLSNGVYYLHVFVRDNATNATGDNAKPWTKEFAIIRQYTVSFNSDGGSIVANETVTENAAATKPADPTRADYTFDGWYDANGQKWDFTTPIYINTVLTARWVRNAIPATPINPGTTSPTQTTRPISRTSTSGNSLLATTDVDETATAETTETPVEFTDVDTDATTTATEDTYRADDGEVLGAEDNKQWSVVNLILAIGTVLTSVIVLIGYLGKGEGEKKHGLWRVSTLIPAAGAVVAFLLTEDWSLPIALVDMWTILMAAITIVVIVLAVKASRNDEKADKS